MLKNPWTQLLSVSLWKIWKEKKIMWKVIQFLSFQKNIFFTEHIKDKRISWDFDSYKLASKSSLSKTHVNVRFTLPSSPPPSRIKMISRHIHPHPSPHDFSHRVVSCIKLFFPLSLYLFFFNKKHLAFMLRLYQVRSLTILGDSSKWPCNCIQKTNCNLKSHLDWITVDTNFNKGKYKKCKSKS